MAPFSSIMFSILLATLILRFHLVATAVAVMAFIPFSAPVTSLLLMSGMSTLPIIFSLGPWLDILFWD